MGLPKTEDPDKSRRKQKQIIQGMARNIIMVC